jgi:hypothetical protein
VPDDGFLLDMLVAAREALASVEGVTWERFAEDRMLQLAAFFASPQVAGIAFEQLRDPAIFAQARVELGAVSWPNGADLAPDAMYDAIQAGGTWTA